MRFLLAFILAFTFAAPAFAVDESATQMALVQSPPFLLRVQYLLVQQARVVKAEALNTTCHVKRSAFADTVFTTIQQTTIVMATAIVGGVNVIGTVSGTAPTAVSSATDAALLSQIATYWNAVSGCDTGA